jgi:hypothetical protein
MSGEEHVKIIERNSCIALLEEDDHHRITLLLRSDASPYVIKLQKIRGLWCASYNKGWRDDYLAWAGDCAEKIKCFGERIQLVLVREISCFEHGFLRLDFRLRPRFLGGWLTERRSEAEKAYSQLKTFVETELDIHLSEDEYHEPFSIAWPADYFFTEEPEKLERMIGWAFNVIEYPYPKSILASRRGVLKALGAATAGALLGSTMKRPSLPEAFAKEVLGTPEVSSGYQVTIEINAMRMPARPYELIKQMRLWERYYADEFALKTWYYWQQKGMPLDQAARKAAQELEDILNQLGQQYRVGWRLKDQILEVRDRGDGTGMVRIRPVISDLMYWSTVYPCAPVLPDGTPATTYWMVQEGIAKCGADHLHWVVGGRTGTWVTIEPPKQTCSNPFGGQCETGCLVGCETACEGNPCMFSCQSGCQTSCEVSCQTCANNWIFCGYTLSCDCVDNGDGTVTVSGRVCYQTPTGGCRPKAGEAVSIYHAGWGTTYVVYTDSQGYYSLTKPKPPGSTAIWVRWTDPNGVEHECSTSACLCPSGTKPCPDGSCVPGDGCCSDADCPPGYRCEGGVCVPEQGGGTGKPIVTNADALDLSAFCSSGITVPGIIRVVDSDGDGIRALLRIIVNGRVVDCVLTDYRGYVNGGRDYFVPISKYRSLLRQGINTVSLQAVWCSSGSCDAACPGCTTTDCSPGIVGDPASKSTSCGCSYSISACNVSATQVQSGSNVTVSGRLSSSNPSLCSVANVPVDVFVNGVKVKTVYTDASGNFSASVAITCSSDTTRTVEVRAGGASCSKQVQCLAPAPQPQTANIYLKWSKTGVPFLEAISIDAFVDGVEVFSYTTPVGDPIEYLVDPDKKLSAAARFWLRQRYNIPSSREIETASDVIRYRLETELNYVDVAKMNKVISGIQSVAKDGYDRWYGVEESVGGIITKVCPDSPPPYPGCECLRKSWTVSECGTTWFRAEKSSTVTL